MTNAIESTPPAPTTALDIEEVLEALEVWINKRPGLEFGNYGAIAPYRAEIRSIAKDKKRALTALAKVKGAYNHDAALLAEAFKRAFSGRLEWIPAGTPDLRGHAQRGHLEYTTGQYWPTEYRKAAASVLETYHSLMLQAWDAAHPRKFTFATLADVKAANQAIGNHWFDRDTMRFFNTRIESKLMTRGSSGRKFFITSESMDSDRPRRYSIREVLENGEIRTEGEFCKYSTLDAAKDAVKYIG